LIQRLLQRSESGLIAEIGLGMFGFGFKIIAAGGTSID